MKNKDDVKLKIMKKYLSPLISHLSSRQGFTLIELLVAISIAAVLSAFLMANFIGVRQRARDGVRKQDLRQIQSALELYRSDQGKYPVSPLPSCGNPLTGSGTTTTYIKKIPCDPSSNVAYFYDSPATNSNYCVRSCLENVDDSERDEIPSKFNANNPAIAECATLTSCSSGKSYTLQNP